MTDPLIKLLLDKDVVDVVSTLIAKLEGVIYDDTHPGTVFKTSWGKSLFNTCTKRMSHEIDLDEWYRAHAAHGCRIRKDIDPALYQQPLAGDWVTALLELELQFAESGGIIRILHNVLLLEDSTIKKLADFSKRDRQYNFEGVPSLTSFQRTIPPAPAANPPMSKISGLLQRK
jgi:hypothetical protein